MLASLTVTAAAMAQVRPSPNAEADPRWAAIRRVFGQDGEAEGAYFRVNLPRSDL